MSCPWASLEPANLRFCEAPLCSWITQPADTWTNVGFLVVAGWVLWRARRDGVPILRWLGWIAVATGLGSAAFHATSTLAGQLVDQNVMLLESSLFIALNVARWRRRSGRVVAGVFVAALAPAAILLAVFTEAGVILFAAQVVVFLSIELRLFVRDRGATRYGALATVGALFAASWGVWWLDRLKILCDPDNHVFTAHGLWHFLGALSFVFWYRHYRQFRWEAGRGEPGAQRRRPERVHNR